MLFKEVIGHAPLKEKLLGSLQAGRVSHAQLFLGENGTGALPLALAYAQYTNCQNPGPEDSCGICDACHKMMSLEYADLHFSFPMINRKPGSKALSQEFLPEWRKALLDNPYLDYMDWMEIIGAENKQGNITADESRDIIRRLSLMPLYEGYKIMLIWLPEYLGKEGNILLKILEEPPARTLFLLVAEDEEQILPTILSRTQLLRVPRITDADLRAALVQKLGIGDEEAGRLSHLAEGNYNLALKLFKEGENDYTEEFIHWMRICFRTDMAGILTWVDKMATTGRENQKNFLVYGLNLFRECLLHRQKLDSLTRILESEKDFVQKFSAFIGPDNIGPLSEAFSTAHYHIERNANPKILLFNLTLQVNELLKRYRQIA
jgi:DNA polymerase-3 subunit delta'